MAAAAKPGAKVARRAVGKTSTLELTTGARLLEEPLGAPMIGESFSIGEEEFCIKVVPLAKQGGGAGHNSKNFLGIFLEYKGDKTRVEAKYTLQARHTKFPGAITLFEKSERSVFSPTARTFGEEQAILHTRFVEEYWCSGAIRSWLSGQLIITAEVEVLWR